mgnify:FL=1
MNGGKKKALIFDFSLQKSCSFLLRTQIQLFTPGAKSKSGFLFSDFDFSLQEIWFFQFFTPRIRKVKSKSHFLPSQNPNFDFSLQQIWFFLLRTRSQNQIFLLKFRLFTPRNQFFSAFYPKKSKSQVKIGFFFFSEPKFRFFTPTNLIFPSQNPKSKSDFSSEISTIHSKKSVFFQLLL